MPIEEQKAQRLPVIRWAFCFHCYLISQDAFDNAAHAVGAEWRGRCIGTHSRAVGLYDLNLELNSRGCAPLQLVIADVSDWQKIDRVFKQHRPQVVFHAAANKQVPLVECHPDEAVRVNIIGTAAVCEMAHEYRAEHLVFISTDKAVNPSSVMGASKYIGELWIKAMSRRSDTIFTAVRFGNVIGSRGSVLPTFTRQIEAGGPVTVTHPEMCRFFMSIPEAVSLVLHAASLSLGGDVFMLDMKRKFPF